MWCHFQLSFLILHCLKVHRKNRCFPSLNRLSCKQQYLHLLMYFVALMRSLEYVQSEGKQLIVLEYIVINFEINIHFCFFCANTWSISDNYIGSLVYLVAWLHLFLVCHLKLFNYFQSQISLIQINSDNQRDLIFFCPCTH